MSCPYSLSANVEAHALAWDTLKPPTSTSQPWREFWPPRNIESLTPEQLKAQPWLTWKRDPANPNEKPWYHWCNIFEGEVDVPCTRTDCAYCEGSGCVCDTLPSYL